LRRILLAVTGLTPQVVTETLYATMREGAERLPHEVRILTTAEGAERARLALLSDSPGWFHRFLEDFGLPPIELRPEHIIVLRDAAGTPLADIRSAADNALAADQVADLVRELTASPDSSLHVSLAGGRKTMGFFAGYALSLWGRPQDRLTHVLVNEPFEQSWDFFYPTPYERIIETRDRKLADCAIAEVTLADIPFVRLRHGLPAALIDGRASFAQAVAGAQARLGPPALTIDLDGRRVRAGGTEFDLPPAELAFLAWFARRAKASEAGLACPSDGAPSHEHAGAYLAEYRRIRKPLDEAADTTFRRYRDGMTKKDFEERKSKLKRALERALGQACAPYLIQGEGRRPMCYRLALDAQAIQFSAVPGSGS
jgi:CRISPR-associated protein (TIGR02584 family)